MNDLFYINSSGKILGPCSVDDFVQLCKLGKITGKELYRKESNSSWYPLSHFKVLIAALRNAASTNAPKEEYTSSLGTIIMDDPITITNNNRSSFGKTTIVKNERKVLGEETKFVANDVPWDTAVSESSIIIPISKIENIPEAPPPPVNIISSDTSTELVEIDVHGAQLAIARAAELELMPESVKPEEEVITELSQRPGLKKISPIGIVAIIAILFFVFYPDKPVAPDTSPTRVELKFPTIYEYEDPVLAYNLYNQALSHYALNTYIGKLNAATLLKNAFGLMSKDPDILGRLVLVYAELLENAKNFSEAKSAITNLLELGKFRSINDINLVTASAIFYTKLEKYLTANTIIENYLRVEKRPSVKLLSYYLKILIELDERVKAREVFDTLTKAPELDIDAYLSMSYFLEADERMNDAIELVVQGITKFPNSVALKLRYLDYLFTTENSSGHELVLKSIEQLYAERNPVFYAKYLEHLGLFAILLNQYDTGAKYLESSLKIEDSNDLRSKLATLRVGGSNIAQKIIRESKIKQMLRTAQKLMRENAWKEAMLLAVNAVDMDDHYYASRFILAQIQSKRGYFKMAIDNYKFLLSNRFIGDQVYYQLIMTYIDAYMIEDAKAEILKISSTPFASTADYAYMLGHFYFRTDNEDLSLNYLQESERRDSSNDLTHYLTAELYLKNRYYKEARTAINKAIRLDPENIEYLAFYGRILLDADGSDVGIGHFLNLLKKFPNNAILLGDIAIAHYKDNEITNFEHYKKLFENAKNPNPIFYNFLIEIAQNSENIKDIIKYSEDLLKIDPGNLQVRMTLAESYYLQKNYPLATSNLNEILQSVEKFPRANYFLGEISFAKADYAKAIEYGEKEIQNNPESELGFYIIGKTLYAQESYQEAVTRLSQAVSKNPSSIEVLYLLSEIKYRQNYLDEALKLCQRAIESEGKLIYDRTKSADLRKLLGEIYKGMGQSVLAVDAFNKYLEIYPTAPDRDSIQEQLRFLNY